MIPDFERLNERMEQLPLNELVPGFDKEAEWALLSQQLHPVKKRKLIPVWSYAAAILLLIAGGGMLTLLLTRTNNQQKTAQNRNITTPPIPITPGIDNNKNANNTSIKASPTVTDTADDDRISKASQNKNIAVLKKHTPGQKGYNVSKNYQAKHTVRNGTPCPIQICISQTMRCPDDHPAAISTCTTLEPDQAVKLTYKEHDKIAKNCSLTIKEIEIKSIATGETILLTASSSPSTAQEAFSYITGEKKGDILAGIFNSDCNHENMKHNIRLDNSYGNVIIQQ